MNNIINFIYKKPKLSLIIGIGIIAIIFIYILTHTASYQGMKKDLISEWTGGLKREVTVYNYGSEIPIRKYKGKLNIFNNNSANEVEFIINNKRIIIHSGLVIIEEE